MRRLLLLVLVTGGCGATAAQTPCARQTPVPSVVTVHGADAARPARADRASETTTANLTGQRRGLYAAPQYRCGN